MVKALRDMIYPGARVRVDNHLCAQSFTATVDRAAGTWIAWKRDGREDLTEWRTPRACNVEAVEGGAVRVFMEDGRDFLTIRPE